MAKAAELVRKLSLEDLGSTLAFLAMLPLGLILRRRRTSIWLVSERPQEARDNAYWFFKHVHDNALHSDTYYVIRADAPDAERIRAVRADRLIAWGSLRHYVYFIASGVHISAHIGGGMPNARVAKWLERFGILRNSKVFVQHGITKDTLDWAFRRSARIDLFCCAAQREMDHILNVYGYSPNQVALTGFCRYDHLVDQSKMQPKRSILIMPTWRKYLADADETEFRHSYYYQTYARLLADPELIDTLESNNLSLVFHLHPGMQRFAHLFTSPSESVEISGARNDIQVLLKESSLLVTDYSSVFFDFAYMAKPVIYYHFDYADFREGHWQTGYFDYHRDGFGPIAGDLAELRAETARAISDGFEPVGMYTDRADGFFAFRDRDNCARTFDAIIAFQ